MRILIATDAWEPQVNGVVRTLRAVTAELRALGHDPVVIAPDQFASVPCPTYGEIRLALTTRTIVGRRIEKLKPDAIHVATEGPIGLAARSWCLKHGVPFTTAYHTHFPDYVAQRTGLPTRWLWNYIRWFHAPARAVLVSTPTVRRQLAAHGLPRSCHWSRGVDLGLFRADAAPHPWLKHVPGPVMLYVGRIAVEKNIEAFLGCSHPGSKIVVGDGPDFARLKRLYPQASFLGALHGSELASAYAAADVLVFPSRTDTFGLVMIEALACGTPVAAFPVPGPIDVVRPGIGALDDDLDKAIDQALRSDRAACAAFAQRFSWESSAREFVAALAPLGERIVRPALLATA